MIPLQTELEGMYNRITEEMKKIECLNRILCHLVLHWHVWVCSFIYWQYYLPNIYYDY